MKKRNIVWQSLAVLAGLILLPLTTQAQDVNARRADQHARIKQGVASGQLTHHEARSVRTREANIHSRERRDRLAHGGHLTHAERTRLNRSLNHTNRAIYRKKHNGAVHG